MSFDEQRPPSWVCDAKPRECVRIQSSGRPHHALQLSEPRQLSRRLMHDILTFADTVLPSYLSPTSAPVFHITLADGIQVCGAAWRKIPFSVIVVPGLQSPTGLGDGWELSF